ncbi:hypothetical protein RN001_015729 [Aquatica leii]|uniref:Cytochrome P450 n=1 Tax=Aquatica leii TaxID=1421715 RepID=A0AAN7SMS8_9COLE|nr:hypothetical protein RN001_015729 [Aquatica leii]
MFCIAILLALVCLIVYKKCRQHDASKIPEPKKLPLIGNMYQLFGLSDNIFSTIQTLNKKYSIYKISHIFTSTIQICNPKDAQIFLSTKQHIKKSLMYRWMQDWLGTGLLTSEDSKWHYRRKLLTPAFHFNILQEFFKVFDEHSQLLVEKLEEECDKPYVDIFSLVSNFTLHIICETAMGIKLDESKKSMREYVNAAQKIGTVLFRRMRRPWLYWNFFHFVSSNKREELLILKTLHDFTTSVIAEQEKSFKNLDVVEYNETDGNFVAKKRLALLDLLMTLKYNGSKINDEGIREEVDTFMFEGHDTTAIAVSFAFMLIANHDEVQNKILDEIQEVTNNFNQKIRFEHLSKLRYLEMVIKETLRLYPSVPAIGRKTTEDIYTSTGYFIPKDTYVGVQIYSIHHNDEYFPNAEKFDPDRFLPENCQNRHPYTYIPFSAGPRNCIGQRFAIMELKMIIASVVMNFKLIPIDTQSSITISSNLTIKTTDGIKVKFEKRSFI